VGFATQHVAALDIPRHVALARAAALRDTWAAHVAAGGGEAPWPPLDAEQLGWLRDALWRRTTLEAVLAGGRGPADWHGFVAQVVDVLDDVQGGTAGVVDTALHARLRAFATAQQAPPPVHDALAFLHGIAAWEWPAASDAAARLVEGVKRGDPWLQTGLLHDGAIVAALKVGQPARAVRAAEVLGPIVRRRPGDVRGLLLASWITRAAATAQPPAPGGPAAGAPTAAAPDGGTRSARPRRAGGGARPTGGAAAGVAVLSVPGVGP
jgi:hypothetical protein